MSITSPLLEIIIHVVAGLGAVLLVYGVFLEKETRQDAVFLIATGALFVYAVWIGSRLFMVAMGLFFMASLIELVEIMVHFHRHSRKEIQDYKHDR